MLYTSSAGSTAEQCSPKFVLRGNQFERLRDIDSAGSGASFYAMYRRVEKRHLQILFNLQLETGIDSSPDGDASRARAASGRTQAQHAALSTISSSLLVTLDTRLSPVRVIL